MDLNERVEHQSRPELGIGRITHIYNDGRYDVNFKSDKISWIPSDVLISVEASQKQEDINQAKKLKHDQKIAKKLAEKEMIKDEYKSLIAEQFALNFLEADEYFKSLDQQFLTIDEYEDCKAKYIQSWALSKSLTKPDLEQAKAIAAVNGHCQVIARAGSGKTTTVVNRCLFLIDHCKVSVGNIMCLAFNADAALEMRKRLLILLAPVAEKMLKKSVKLLKQSRRTKVTLKSIEANAVDRLSEELNIPLPHIMTFHSLAYSLVHPENSPLYDDEITGNLRLSQHVQKIVDEFLLQPDYMHLIKEVMMAYFRTDWNNIEQGKYYLNKEEFLQFRRSIQYKSLNNEYVKSHGEKLIADYLFEHNIPYRYERNFFWKGINYRPDFSVNYDADEKRFKRGLIIEYYGLVGDEDYERQINNKRAFWSQNPNCQLIEIFPKDIVEGITNEKFQAIKKHLLINNFSFKRLSEHDIWLRIKDRAIDEFTKVVRTFIMRCRKDDISPDELKYKLTATEHNSPMFTYLKLAGDFYQAYLNRIETTQQDDFDGLLLIAIEKINNSQDKFLKKHSGGQLRNIQYLCIDEFQDFSKLFWSLVDGILKLSPEISIFTVGDDWQAINGFSGSDLKYFQNLGAYLENPAKKYISTNYRSTNIIVKVSNALMAELGPEADCYSTQNGRVQRAYIDTFNTTPFEDDNFNGDRFTPLLLRLIQNAAKNGHGITLLSRANYLPYLTGYSEEFNRKDLNSYCKYIRKFFPEDYRHKISFNTTHKYKGLQNDTVVILDALVNKYPLIHPNLMFTEFFGDSLETTVEEERRLFYVAITRAKTNLIILTEQGRESPFLQHLPITESLKWDKLPHFTGKYFDSKLLIIVSNAPLSKGTYAIKENLKEKSFRYEGNSQIWQKTLLKEYFSLSELKTETWAKNAEDVMVTIKDQFDKKLAKYSINDGQWKQEYNYLK